MLPKIVFFGNERLATGVTTQVPVLQGLLDTGYDVKSVVLAQKPAGKSRNDRTPEIMQVLEKRNLSHLLHAPGSWRDQAEIDALKSLNADVGVLVAYGKIVSQSVIDVFPQGIVNIHPSALPLHRGPTPLESVILDGADVTAVSLMQLSAKMDAGPVYAQERVGLSGQETKQALADGLGVIGRDMLLRDLPSIVGGALEPVQQDTAKATYDGLLTKASAEIDWQRPAVEIERHIRAYAGWPKSRANIGGRDVAITQAHVIKGSGTPGVIWLQDKQLGMHTNDGILVIDELVPSGKKPMSGSDFLLGYRPA